MLVSGLGQPVAMVVKIKNPLLVTGNCLVQWRTMHYGVEHFYIKKILPGQILVVNASERTVSFSSPKFSNNPVMKNNSTFKFISRNEMIDKLLIFLYQLTEMAVLWLTFKSEDFAEPRPKPSVVLNMVLHFVEDWNPGGMFVTYPPQQFPPPHLSQLP